MKTIKSVLIGALVALLGSSAWAEIGVDKNPVPEVGIGDAGAVTITLTSTETSDRDLSFSSSSAATTHWQNDYISVDLSSSKILKNGGTITATIKGLKETENQQTFSIYRASRTTKYLDIRVNKVAEPKFVDHGEVSIAIAPEGKQVITATSAAAADWTIWSDKEEVATVDPKSVSGKKDATFTIIAKGKEGDVTTCVASNKYSKWTYRVGIDSHTEIDPQTVNFSRGKTEQKFNFTCEKEKTTWYAWTDRPDLVSVKLESADPKVGFAAVRPGDAEKVTGAQSVNLTVSHDLTNPSGTATVYVQADGDSICHEIKVVCDAVNSIYFNMRHSDTLEEMSETSQSWYRIPTEWVKPEDIDEDYGHTFSADTDVIEIVEADDAFWLHAPVKGHDGVVRVVFIKDERELLNGGGKIWMFNVTVNSVEIEKFLTFKDESKRDSEATLNIRTHYLDNVTADVTNRVLFVGTGCSSHSLNRGTIADTLTTIAKKAEVDYYIFEGGESVSQAKDNNGVGTLQKGQTITESQIRSLDNNNHCNLNGFFELFGSLAQNPETRYKYDYIVMEFDAQRIAASPTSGKSDGYVFNQWRDVMVAEWLNEYYEGVKDSPGSRIIWIVDDQVNKTGKSTTSPKDLLNGSETAEDFFRPYQAHISGSSNHFRYEEMTDDRFRALLALLNPWLYLEVGLQDATSDADLAARLDSCCGTHDYVFHQDSATAGAWDDPRTVRVGETYKYQAYYNDLDGLKKFLDENIKVTSYAAEITDNVETEGLGLVEGTLKIYGAYATNGLGKAEQWTELQSVGQPGMAASGTVWAVGNSITGITENITREFWNWVVVDLKDTNGQFRAGAKYDATLDKYVRDPNLNTNALDVAAGEAALVYFYDITNPDAGVWDEAETTWDWAFDPRTIALNAQGVNRPYDGTSTNATYTVAPADATVKVSYSNAVGKTWSAFEPYNKDKFTDVTKVLARFVATKDGYLSATSEAWVVISAAPMTLSVEGVERYYNGTSTNVTYSVTPADADIKVCYKAGSEDWSDPVAYSKTQFRNATNVQVRVIASKKNYVTQTNDSASVWIKPRSISVSANPGTKVYDGKGATGKLTATYCPEAFDGESGKGIVPGEGNDVSNDLKKIGITCDLGAKGNVGSYDIGFASKNPSAAGVNYVVSYGGNTYTVTPATIATKHYNSNETPAAGTKPYAWAKDVDVSTNKYYEIIVDGDGTNIEFKCELYDGDDPKYRFSYDGVNWSDAPTLFKEIVFETNVWVEVSSKTAPIYNYFTNTVSAKLTIRSWECELEDQTTSEEKLENADTTKTCLEGVLTKYVNAGSQSRIDTNLKLSFKTVSADGEAKSACDEALERFKATYGSDVTDVKIQVIDAKLLLSTKDGDVQSDPEPVHDTKGVTVDFWVKTKVNMNDYNALGVYADHVDGLTTLLRNSSYKPSADGKTMKISSQKFSYFIIIWGHVVPKPVYENSALLPLPYEYKASIKHMYLKEVKVKGVVVYQKYLKAASLKGYLVIDRQGATSQAIVKADTKNGNNIPGTCADYGANRAFLIVRNANAETSVRKPKVLPAVIDAKWIDTAFTKGHKASSGVAEGTLYVGGDAIACMRPQIDEVGGAIVEREAVPNLPAEGVPGMVAVADYLWTSVYLFGLHNGPNWYKGGPYDAFEAAWDANLPAGLQIGFAPGKPHFHDTWMNGAGIGRYFIPDSDTIGDLCCGLQPTIVDYEPVLESLSGQLKGGLFLCTENGVNAKDPAYVFFDGIEWEDQFVTGRLDPAGMFAPDHWQNDLWQDGFVEQETTDVLYGNWSIKYCRKFFVNVYKTITDEEMEAMAGGPLANHVESAIGLYNLAGAIKGSVLKLDKTATFVETKKADKEIYSKPANARLAVPAITPKFAQYFGLANWW